MHECVECGQACDCDQEDTWFEEIDPTQCFHECHECEESDDFDGGDYEYACL